MIRTRLTLTSLALCSLGWLACASPVDPSGDVSLTDVGDDVAMNQDAVPVGWTHEVQNPVWRLTLGTAGLEALERDVYADVSVPGTLIASGGVYAVDVKLQGGSSRAYPKKNFRLSFLESARFMGDIFQDGGEEEGFSRLILRASWKDQSYVREALAFEALRRIGLDAPRVTWINLELNGDYAGLYAVVEPLDVDYVVRRGFRPGGALYKAAAQKAGFKPGVDLQAGYEKKSKKCAPYDDLQALMDLIWRTPVTEAEYLEELDPVFSLSRLRRRLMWASYTQNSDSIRHNYYLYHEPAPESETEEGGRWWIFPWDSDISFANHWKQGVKSDPVDNATMISGPAYFSQQFATMKGVRRLFADEFLTHLSGPWAADSMGVLAEQIFAKVSADVARDLLHWERSSSAAEEFDEIRDFVVQRPSILLPLLNQFYEDPALDELYF